MTDSNYAVSWPGWEIVGRIGRGGFGTVYKIQRDVYGDVEEAALKVITIPQSDDEVDFLRYNGLTDANITQTFHQQVGDIAREYNLMKQMRDNPNVVRCDDFRDIQHDDGLGWDIYIKMELLTPLLKAPEKVKDTDQIIRLGMDICNALTACHAKDIIHRDIKPQNVFVAANGNFKLGDFGIARTIERTTRATAGIGTYSYMAPEVERHQPYGKTADIYSLGLMMYWLLNERRQPFMPLPPAAPKHGDEEAARHRRFSGEPIPAPKNGSDELKSIVLKACAFNSKDRYQSAQEMLIALRALTGVVIPAVIPSKQKPSASAAVPDLPEESEDTTVLSRDRIVSVTSATVPATPEPNLPEEPDDSTVASDHCAPASDPAPVSPTPVFRPPEDLEPPAAKPDNQTPVSTSASAFRLPEDLEHAAVTPDNPPPASDPAPVPSALVFRLPEDLEHAAVGPDSRTPPAPAVAAQPLIVPGLQPDPKASPAPILDASKIPSHPAAPKEKRWPLVVVSVVIIILLLLMLLSLRQCSGVTLSKQTGWTEWLDSVPDHVTAESYEIEKTTVYRSRQLETTTSTTQSEMSGWELYDTAESGEFGPWSDWSSTEIAASETREVETQNRYRYRDKETKTASTSTLSGWEHYDTTYTWGDYGNWSSWSTTEVSNSDMRQVETQIQYRSRSKNYQRVVEPDFDTFDPTGWTLMSVDGEQHGCTEWSAWSTTPVSPSETRYVETKNIDGVCYYRYQDVIIWEARLYYRWGEWGNWTTTEIKDSVHREVETRTLFRFRDRIGTPTYYFFRWSSWSDWTTNQIVQTDTRQVVSAAFYRHRDIVSEVTYYFQRWGDWSEWNSDPITSSDTVDVESKTMYRYKSKD